jgi:D-glycero-D-manno-heptose 1,7-bisphosphate phosphatase
MIQKIENKAFFIDKDGTIVDNKDYPRVIPTDKLLLKDIIKGLKLIKEKGYKIFIISNQSAIAKKRLSYSDVEKTFRNIIKELSKYKIEISDYIYCPHKTEDKCECKKPKTKMIENLITRHNIKREESFVVGDMDKDIFMGKNAGIRTILVRTGRGKDFEKETEADFVIENLNEIWKVLE